MSHRYRVTPGPLDPPLPQSDSVADADTHGIVGLDQNTETTETGSPEANSAQTKSVQCIYIDTSYIYKKVFSIAHHGSSVFTYSSKNVLGGRR
jgi:hypothetical protein